MTSDLQPLANSHYNDTHNKQQLVTIICNQANKKFYCRMGHFAIIIKHLHYYKLNIIRIKNKVTNLFEVTDCSKLGTCKITYLF